MKKNKLVVTGSLFSLLALFGSGCGKNISGTYSLMETQSGGALSSSCLNSQTTLTLTENNTNVSGNASNTCFNESLTGTHNSSDQINNVVLSLVQANQYAASQTCIYTGNLSMVNKQVTGSLTLQNSAAGGYSSCSSAVTISGSFIN